MIGLLSVSPAAAEGPPGGDGATYFETHIRPLFVRHCYGCHSDRAGEAEGDLRLDNQRGWLQGGRRGPMVVPGDVASSLLLRAVRYEDPELEMPPSQPLSTEEIARLERWVAMGAPGGDLRVDATASDPADPIAGRQHWAFQPLRALGPPDVIDTNWCLSPIDRFVLAELERRGLQPAPPADRSQLVRRLSFQLTGLPPGLDELTAVLDDARPDALTQYVDRLLGSAQFGERWGRHWLDLARYADSNGLDENFLFREAWRYRNWVIQAVNHDLPFDRFLREQIAGDLLPFDSLAQRDQQRVAAGFLVVGPKVLLGIDENKQRMDIADEHIDTIGRVVLGQTLGCARCHDHKFDPIPTADYYALAGIFASTQVMETRYMLGQQRLMERLVGLGADGSRLDEAYETYWRHQPERKQLKQSAQQALQALRDEDAPELEQLAGQQPCPVSLGAKDEKLSLEERIACQEAFVDELSRWLEHPPPIPPRAMVPADADHPQDEAIRLAGQYDAPGETIPRGFLTVLSDDPPTIAPEQSGRVRLAEWLVDTDQPSGQLAARVLANRVWHHLIGRGLVRTVDNFGRTGESPTHPELLDYLARRLIESNWSIKCLVREIALSQTFAMSSRFDAQGDTIDPDNRFLWRAHRRRLDAESLRDALLSVADQLDLAPRDSTVDYLGDQATAVGANEVRRRTDFPCRSVYLPVIRNDLPELFETFDFANPHIASGTRPRTIVPTQGLFMLNDTMVMDAARATAQRVIDASGSGDVEERVSMMFQLVLGDSASQTQRASMRSFLTTTEQQLHNQQAEQPQLEALVLACHALVASSRFQFLD